MAVLPVTQAHEAATKAYDELQLPVGSPPEQILATFRTLCLQRIFQIHGNNNPQINAAELFQRQAVAYRFLRSVPLQDKTEYTPDAILARLRPLDSLTNDEGLERASAMLDISILTMEQAQRAWELPYTNYVINVHYSLRKHCVRRRYREFEALHAVLAEKLPVIPALPERKWLYKLQMPSDRAQSLAQYLTRVVTLLANRGLFSIEIMEFLEIDFARVRAEEEALAINFLARQGGTNVFYIVAAGWLDSWKRFVRDGHHPPPRISNEPLLDRSNGSSRVKDSLLAGRHYRSVNALSWQYFTAIYGGGPAIMRKTPSIYGRKVYDMPTLAVLLQKIVRGFLGRMYAKRRRLYLLRQDPTVERQLGLMERKKQLEERMVIVRKYVTVREYQIRHVAIIRIQRAFRKYLLRQEHALLMAESAVPHEAENFQHIEEYYSLEEIGLIKDPSLRLAHFLVTMNKGVPIQKLRSRRKVPQWRLFRINQIGSQLIWSSKKRTHVLAFIEVSKLVVESPLRLKSGFGRRRSTTYDHAVVMTYEENNVPRELILICESQCDCDALYLGLDAVITEAKTRTANGASYVDGHGVIRKKYPHAKRLIQTAQQVVGRHQQQQFGLPSGVKV